MNEKVKETKKHIKMIKKYIQENKDRYRLLDEHYRNIRAVDLTRKSRPPKRPSRTSSRSTSSSTT